MSAKRTTKNLMRIGLWCGTSSGTCKPKLKIRLLLTTSERDTSNSTQTWCAGDIQSLESQSIRRERLRAWKNDTSKDWIRWKSRTLRIWGRGLRTNWCLTWCRWSVTSIGRLLPTLTSELKRTSSFRKPFSTLANIKPNCKSWPSLLSREIWRPCRICLIIKALLRRKTFYSSPFSEISSLKSDTWRSPLSSSSSESTSKRKDWLSRHLPRKLLNLTRRRWSPSWDLFMPRCSAKEKPRLGVISRCACVSWKNVSTTSLKCFSCGLAT